MRSTHKQGASFRFLAKMVLACSMLWHSVASTTIHFSLFFFLYKQSISVLADALLAAPLRFAYLQKAKHLPRQGGGVKRLRICKANSLL